MTIQLHLLLVLKMKNITEDVLKQQRNKNKEERKKKFEKKEKQNKKNAYDNGHFSNEWIRIYECSLCYIK